jgi:hypothetical protein
VPIVGVARMTAETDAPLFLQLHEDAVAFGAGD